MFAMGSDIFILSPTCTSPSIPATRTVALPSGTYTSSGVAKTCDDGTTIGATKGTQLCRVRQEPPVIRLEGKG